MKTSVKFKPLLAPLLLLLIDTAARAQSGDHNYVSVRATVEPAEAKPGGQAWLKLTLKLAAEAHVNSDAPKDPNLIPTIFMPRPTAGIIWGQPQYPEPSEVMEWYSVDPLIVFEDGAVITVPLTIEPAAAGSLELSGVLVAQACDHEQCYPAKRLTITVSLTLAGGTPTPAKAVMARTEPQAKEQTRTVEPDPAQMVVPDFAFTDFNGKARKLSEFRGKVVLLDFWATWCSPCMADFPHLKELYAKHQASGFEIIGLDCETLGDEAADAETIKAETAQAKAVIARFGATWTMAENNSAVAIAGKIFRVEGLPTRILIDRQGAVVRKVKSREELELLLARLLEQK